MSYEVIQISFRVRMFFCVLHERECESLVVIPLLVIAALPLWQFCFCLFRALGTL